MHSNTSTIERWAIRRPGITAVPGSLGAVAPRCGKQVSVYTTNTGTGT